MEAFEIVRRQASALHAELVEAGADPHGVLGLCLAAAQSLDLEVAFLPQGDASLKGARALLDEHAGTILCEDVGADVQRAMLVAHEIGHAVVHASSAHCNAEDIDPSQSTEAAPVGLQRVEDYGKRERRELQANVFAREFVLPRERARSLYLDGGLSTNQIAERTGLGIALVRQQVLDAILLPAVVEEEQRAPLVPKRDLAQERAAAHRGSPFQLQAGPGTGKTRTLVKRIASLVEEGIDPSAILALTFSNRAAGELAERVAQVLPDKAPNIWIGTFHSFGLDLLRRSGTSIGLSADPQLFDRSDAIAVLEEILPTLGLKHYRNLWDPTLVLRDILSGISRAKDEMVDHHRYRELAEEMLAAASTDEQRKAAEKCVEVALIYDHYEAEKRARGAVDFGDLIMLPALMLESDPKLAAAIQLRHRHVLVDEYQDVNRASVRLVQALAGDAKRLWVVGDARQAIYRFRGASSGNMAAFKTDFPGGEDDALEVSYRSTEAVIGTFIRFAQGMRASDGMRPLALTTDGGAGASTELRTLDTLEDEISGLAGSIRELEEAGVALRDQAVLCRTNARLNEIALGLEARGVPVLHLGSLFEREEIRDLLAVLSLAVDARGSGLARVGAMPRYDIPLQDVYRALHLLKATGKDPPLGLRDIAKDERLTTQGATGLSLLASDLQGLKREAMPWDFITTYLLDHTDLGRRLASPASVSDWMRAAAIWQFLNFLRVEAPVGGSFPIWRSLERIRQLVLLAEERDLRQVPAAALQMNAVRLMTIHGSKGLEFEAVHIPGLTEVSIPSSYRGLRCPPPDKMIADSGTLDTAAAAKLSHETEEECLFFVAASRARRHLRLSLSRTQKNGKGRKASSYLGKIGALTTVSSPAMIPLPAGVNLERALQIVTPPNHAITDSALGQYKRCPRRYFYTHLLGLGGGRRPTAFTQTHDCLYTLMEWLRVRQATGTPDIEEVEAKFEEIWQEDGLGDRTGSAEYRKLASRILKALVNAGTGVRFKEGRPIALDLQAGRVVVEPNAIAELDNGTVVLRRVRTGHRRSDEYGDTDHIEYGLYIHAGRVEFGHGSIVQAVHLTDDLVEAVELKDNIIGNRLDDVNAMLASITAGAFPASADPTKCARCPHFFVCAAAPAGTLTLDPPTSAA